MKKIVDIGTKKRSRNLSNMETRKISSEVEHDTTLSNSYTKVMGLMESPDFFTPVEAPLKTVCKGKEIPVPNKKAIVNEDDGKVVSVVGKDYKLILNSEIFGEFDRALSESEIDLTDAYKTVNICRGGAQTILGYSFPAYETTITDRVVGDVVRLAVQARNSYDGFTMFSANFSQMRLACMNSMVAATDISYFAGKHTQQLVVEHAVEKIKRSIDVFMNNADLYRRWADTPVSDDEAVKLFQKFCVKSGYKTEFNEKKVDEHTNQWLIETGKLGKNRWALYNTLTYWATHAEVQKRVIEAGNQKERQVVREEKLRKFLSTRTDWFKEAA